VTVSLGTGAAQGAPDPRETARIHRLIDAVEQQKNMRFVRNGKEYDCREAAAFLRGKLKWKLDDVATAEDFIVKIGSSSTTTGEPYSVRLADGRLVPAGDYLRAELKRLEAAPAPPR